MRLLQINPVVRINTSTGRIMQEIANLASQHGWECYIAYSKGRDGLRGCGTQIVPVGNRLSTAWHGVVTRFFDCHGLASSGATRQFIKEIERIKPDVVHIHNIHGYFLNYKLLFQYLSKTKIHVVWTAHDCWLYTGHCYHYSFAKCNKWQTHCGKCPQRKEFPASYFIDRSWQNFEDKKLAFTSIPQDRFTIVAVSHWIREEMAKSFLKNCRFCVIRNGIDLELFNVCETDIVRQKYGLLGKHIILGVASIWMPEKGWGDFMKLSAMINDDEVIVLVGVKDAQRANLPSNIIPISKTENIRQLAELYSAADVFVNPTWQDNYPTVNLESIACGTPVVTYKTGGSVESVTEETGVIVDQGDVNGLLHAIRLIESRGKGYYRNNCRQYAMHNFNKVNCYSEYLDLYKSLVLNTSQHENTTIR